MPSPRMDKGGQEHRLRGSRGPPWAGARRRFAGVDIASETHVVALVDEDGKVLVKPTAFAEDAAGYEVGTLLTSIEGIGPNTAARLIAERGDPAAFRAPAALAAYVGVIPALRQSGKRKNTRAATTPTGNARLRAALWMPTLTAVRKNPWLRAHYQRLLARGKLPKVALVACMHKLLFAVYSVAQHRRPCVAHLTRAQATP